MFGFDFSHLGITDIMLAITGYVTIWVFCLFMTLPLFIEKQDLSKRTVEEIAAPKQAYIGRKMAITSILAFVIWGGLHLWLLRDGFSFREWIMNF